MIGYIECLAKITSNPEDYHGLFLKADNFGRYYFKYMDTEIERSFRIAKTAKKFGI